MEEPLIYVKVDEKWVERGNFRPKNGPKSLLQMKKKKKKRLERSDDYGFKIVSIENLILNI